MMADRRATNRAMFWRIIRRLFGANRGRLFVMLLALGAGAAVTAALLNLQVDAKRRLTTDFLAFGPNAVIVPRDIPGSPHDFATETLDESVLSIAPSKPQGRHFIGFPFLYVASSVSSETSSNPDQAIVAGTYLNLLFWAEPVVKMVPESGPLASGSQCYAGVHIAEKMQLHPGSIVRMASGNQAEKCVVAGVLSSGGPADSQVFVSLDVAQRLAGLPGRLSVIKLRVGGTPQEIQDQITALAKQLPQAEVRPIRQFTEGEAKIYNRISGLLTATVAIVLVLTGLCVMAAMTNVAMERKMDVGLMKAVGGSTRRVLRFFLAEAALLGLVGGVIGAALGIILSMGLGKAVFGVAARPRLIVYPVAVMLTIIVAILSAYPLRRLAGIRPASVFRGEA
jgi:putative ABC transport system permease protein